MLEDDFVDHRKDSVWQNVTATDDDAEHRKVLPNTVFSVINEIIFLYLTVCQQE